MEPQRGSLKALASGVRVLPLAERSTGLAATPLRRAVRAANWSLPSLVVVRTVVNRTKRESQRPRHRCSEVVVRGGVEPPTFRFSGGRSYQLSYLTSTGVSEDQQRLAASPR